MIIKSIELENIRSYKKETISFDTGINFLSGDIGSGKSTILLAIEFAFFGFKKGDIEGFELLRKGESKGSIKLVLEDKSKVFEIFRSVKKQKSTDMISQEIGYVKDGDSLIELTPKELNAYVFGLLNFPKEFLTKNKNLVYRFSVYTPQENLKSILFDTSESRLEVIRKIFGIDKYKQLLNSFDIFLKKIREDKKIFDVKLERKSKISNEIKVLNGNVEILEKDVKKFSLEDLRLQNDLKKHKDAIEKRDTLIDKLSKNLLVLEKKKSTILEIEEQIKSLKVVISNIEKEKDSFDEKKIKFEIEKLEKLVLEKDLELKKKLFEKSEIKKFLKSKDDLIDEKQKFEKEILLFENKNIEFEKFSGSFDYILTKCQVKDLENFILKDKVRIKKLEKFEVEFTDISKNRIELELKLESLSDDLIRIEDKIKNISNIDFCDSCLQKVSKEHRVDIEKNLKNDKLIAKESISEKKKELLVFEKRLKVLDKEILDLSNIKEDLIQKEERIKSLYDKELKEKLMTEDLKNLRLDLGKFSRDDIEKNLKELDLKMSEFKKKEILFDEIDVFERRILEEISVKKFEIKDLLQKIIDYKNLDSNLKKENDLLYSLIQKIKLKKDILEKINEFEIKEEKLRGDRSLLKKKYDDYLSSNNEVNRELMRVKTDLKSTVDGVMRNNKDLMEIERIEKDYSKLLFNETFLRTSASEILLQIERSVFSKYYAEFNDEFERLFKELIEDNDIDVRLNSEFSPVIEQNGYDIDVKNLSGGEKSSLAIAYRLGLKKIIESNLDSKQKLSLLILDEPTDGFSNEQIDRLGNILKDTKLKQIILVSHDEKIESIADRVLHIEKTNHVSKIV
ncbi:MAG: SMC family ATPase [Candidatus Woesearchaeota archaeon]|jgi:exonuclease SbcC|nr:SMC family ATPase [Candidatus Woesearchaeota archaeon]